MKSRFSVRRPLLLLVAHWLFAFTAGAQGTAFTYEGLLQASGGPADGIYDLRFTACDAVTNGHVLGGPVTNSAVMVTNGLFTTTVDFGAGVFTGAAVWLQVEVRTTGAGGFTALSPRQPVTATPYAVMAGNANGISTTNVSGYPTAAQMAQAANAAVNTNVVWTTFTNGARDFQLKDYQLTGALGTAAFLNTNAFDLAGTAAAVAQAATNGRPPLTASTISTNYLTATNVLAGAGVPGVNGPYAPFDWNNIINGNTVNPGGYFLFGGGTANGGLTSYPLEIDDPGGLTNYYYCLDTNGLVWYSASETFDPPPAGHLIQPFSLATNVWITGNGSGITNAPYLSVFDPNVAAVLSQAWFWGCADSRETSTNSRGLITRGPLSQQQYVTPFIIPGQDYFNQGPAQPEIAVRQVNGEQFFNIFCAQFAGAGHSIWMRPVGWSLVGNPLTENWTAYLLDPINPTNTMSAPLWLAVSNLFSPAGQVVYTNCQFGQPSFITDRGTGTNWLVFGITPNNNNSSPQVTCAAPFLDAACTRLGAGHMLYQAGVWSGYYDASCFYGVNSNWANLLCQIVVAGGNVCQIWTNSANSMDSTNWSLSHMLSLGGRLERPQIIPVYGLTNWLYALVGNFTPSGGSSFDAIFFSYDLQNFSRPITNSLWGAALTNNYGPNGLKFCQATPDDAPVAGGGDLTEIGVTRPDGTCGLALVSVLTTPLSDFSGLQNNFTNSLTFWADGSVSGPKGWATLFGSNVLTGLTVTGPANLASTLTATGIVATLIITNTAPVVTAGRNVTVVATTNLGVATYAVSADGTSNLINPVDFLCGAGNGGPVPNFFPGQGKLAGYVMGGGFYFVIPAGRIVSTNLVTASFLTVTNSSATPISLSYQTEVWWATNGWNPVRNIGLTTFTLPGNYTNNIVILTTNTIPTTNNLIATEWFSNNSSASNTIFWTGAQLGFQ